MDTLNDTPTNTPEKKSTNKFIVPAALLSLTGVIGTGAFLYFKNTQSKDFSQTNNVEVLENRINRTSDTNTDIVNGSYTAVGTYVSPAGVEEIEVTLSIEDNIITNALVVSKATADASVKYQKEFIDNYKEQVIGKNMNQLMLVKVSGSSLTPKGFNDALQKIKDQVKK